MPRRLTRDETEAMIIDRAAALFARHGAHTSLQQVAEAVGYSKAGLLHHFPSKEALQEAARASSHAQIRGVLTAVSDVPAGPARDRRGIEGLVDAALAAPGLTALGLSAVSALGAPVVEPPVEHDPTVWEIFAITDLLADGDRTVRVLSAMAGLSVTTLVAHQLGAASVWREAIVTAALDALDHRRSSAPTVPAAPDLVEA